MKLRPCAHEMAGHAAEAALLRAIQPVSRLNRTAYISTDNVPDRPMGRTRRGSFAGRGVLRSGGVTLPCDGRWHRLDK